MNTATELLRIIVQPSLSNPDMWYWALLIDHECYADGEEATEQEAMSKARANHGDWSASNN